MEEATSTAGHDILSATCKTIADLSTRLVIQQTTHTSGLKPHRKRRCPLRDAEPRCHNRKYGQQVSTPSNSFPTVTATPGSLSHWHRTSHQQTMKNSRYYTLAGAARFCGAALVYIVSAFRTSPSRAPISEIRLAAIDTA